MRQGGRLEDILRYFLVLPMIVCCPHQTVLGSHIRNALIELCHAANDETACASWIFLHDLISTGFVFHNHSCILPPLKNPQLIDRKFKIFLMSFSPGEEKVVPKPKVGLKSQVQPPSLLWTEEQCHALMLSSRPVVAYAIIPSHWVTAAQISYPQAHCHCAINTGMPQQIWGFCSHL